MAKRLEEIRAERQAAMVKTITEMPKVGEVEERPRPPVVAERPEKWEAAPRPESNKGSVTFPYAAEPSDSVQSRSIQVYLGVKNPTEEQIIGFAAVYRGLKNAGAKMNDGKEVDSIPDAVRWIGEAIYRATR